MEFINTPVEMAAPLTGIDSFSSRSQLNCCTYSSQKLLTFFIETHYKNYEDQIINTEKASVLFSL